MNKSIILDKKIIELQKAVKTLRSNRDKLVKELEIVKERTAHKMSL
ncbi:MAG: hypothetical protein JXR64_06615 [Spirochaetales bacterium]|nr:hypothetical protein [Spirochaetales bacterium]